MLLHSLLHFATKCNNRMADPKRGKGPATCLTCPGVFK